MGYTILFDAEEARAVLYDTTSERAIDHEGFIGADARDQAENFLDWLDLDPRDGRGLRRRGFENGNDEHGRFVLALDRAISAWRASAFNSREEFIGA